MRAKRRGGKSLSSIEQVDNTERAGAHRRVATLIVVYRLLITAGLAFGALFSQSLFHVPAEFSLSLVAVFYLLFALSCVIMRDKADAQWVRLFFLIDLLCIVFLMHLFGGVNTSLGLILVVFVLGAAALMNVRDAVAMAAIASLLILAEQGFQVLMNAADVGDFFRAGLFGSVYLFAALSISTLARQVSESRSLAEQRGIDLRNMSELNEYVIQRMGSGVIVVDDQDNITLTNDAAWYLMGFQERVAINRLENISRALYEQLRNWREAAFQEGHTLSITGSSDVLPRFIGLGDGRAQGVLILIEDSSLLNQQAQHMKLTAMGRLTASIAHEIRNPLGAISHAAQLLTESQELQSADRRLVEIIQTNSARTNNVIENIMQLTRKDKASPETVVLRGWMNEFVEELLRNHKLEPEQIHWSVEPEDLVVEFDPGHLHQILTNLCQNALLHGLTQAQRSYIELRIGVNADSRGPQLDVIDYGPGIDPETARQIFEPFYTTATKGTGLGLYIARELASVNQAKLDYVPVPSGGSCFRMTFKDR